ncbi:hypothetical protein CU048_05780 [Beijerinckiaceae bacterium]|nr:hypothetical protein CU048_05780 [Beijerinckiaceae bacterium]
MLKIFLVFLFFAAGWTMVAYAQTDSSAALGLTSEQNGPWPLGQDYLNGAVPLNRKFVTSTGQTVPRPSLAPDVGTSHVERKIIDSDSLQGRSICSNC